MDRPMKRSLQCSWSLLIIGMIMIQTQVNWDILTEGYSHHTPEPCTIQHGHDTHRDPDLILDEDKFVVHAASILEELYSKQPMLKEIFGELYNMKKLQGKAKK